MFQNNNNKMFAKHKTVLNIMGTHVYLTWISLNIQMLTKKYTVNQNLKHH